MNYLDNRLVYSEVFSKPNKEKTIRELAYEIRRILMIIEGEELKQNQRMQLEFLSRNKK